MSQNLLCGQVMNINNDEEIPTINRDLYEDLIYFYEYYHLHKKKIGSIITWGEYWDLFKSKDEAPATRLVTCAITLNNVLPQLNKCLRTKLDRQNVVLPPVKVRHLDLKCVQKISKMPGKNIQEKIKLNKTFPCIIRVQTIDTFENRVLKKLCTVLEQKCKKYLIRIKDTIEKEKSKRFELIQHLLVQVKRLLSEKLGEVSASSPMNLHPNYVLMHNTKYKIVWQNWLIVHQESSFFEDIHKNKMLFIREVVYDMFHSYVIAKLEAQDLGRKFFCFQVSYPKPDPYNKNKGFKNGMLSEKIKHPGPFFLKTNNSIFRFNIEKNITISGFEILIKILLNKYSTSFQIICIHFSAFI